jgi:hypothetical protein
MLKADDYLAGRRTSRLRSSRPPATRARPAPKASSNQRLITPPPVTVRVVTRGIDTGQCCHGRLAASQGFTSHGDINSLDRTEVTDSQHRQRMERDISGQPRCWDRTDFNMPGQLMVSVDWGQAYAYCQWARLRLPTEAEWLKAGRGTEGRAYVLANLAPECDRVDYRGSVGLSLANRQAPVWRPGYNSGRSRVHRQDRVPNRRPGPPAYNHVAEVRFRETGTNGPVRRPAARHRRPGGLWGHRRAGGYAGPCSLR